MEVLVSSNLSTQGKLVFFNSNAQSSLFKYHSHLPTQHTNARAHTTNKNPHTKWHASELSGRPTSQNPHISLSLSLSLSLLCQTHTNPNHTLSLLNIFSHQPSLTTLQYYHLGVCLCIFFVWIINLYKVVALLGQLTDLPQSHLTFFLSLSLSFSLTCRSAILPSLLS